MQRIKRHIGTHHITGFKSFIIILSVITGGFLGLAYSVQAYPEVFKTEISFEKKIDIAPQEPVAIDFSAPILAGDYASQIQITDQNSNNQSVKIRWENSSRRLVIVPDTFWKPENEYTVSLPAGRNAMLAKVEAQKFSFSTIKYPAVKKVNPEDGAKNVMIDIEDPMVVNFDQPTDNFFIKFVLNPNVEMTYQNNIEKTEFSLLPKTKIENGKTYSLDIYAKFVDDKTDDYRKVYSSSFDTPPLPVKLWEKDFSARIAQAKKFTQAQIQEGKYIDINLSQQILSIFQDGKLLDSFLISTGKRGMDTPKGTFKVLTKRNRPWSKKYGLYMPWFMQFTSQGHGIHELPEWPGGYKEGANHLGIPVSHGCVRLGIGPAKTAYDWAETGTAIVVY